MTAAISMNRGKAEMAFVGELPWHGLGQKLTEDASLEVWAKEAGMNWKVLRSKVRYSTSRDVETTGALRTWDDNHVLFRSDSKAPLSIVSQKYKVVQPIEVLEFFRDLVEKHDMKLETAGCLFGGAKYWALAKTKHSLRIMGTDVLGGYLLLASSCDGSMSSTGKFTSVRVVCQNTMAVALSGGGVAVRVPHSTTFDADKVKVDLGLLDKSWTEFGEMANTLAKVKLSKNAAMKTLIKAWGDYDQFELDLKKNGIDQAITNQEKHRVMADVLDLFDGKARGSNLKSSDGTAWGLVNAATEFFDHNAGRIQDRRLASAWFGKNSNRKQELVETLLAA